MATTILIIDDNVVLARAFARVLTEAGYRVHTWHSAEDGLRQAKLQRPDAIILDLQMPFVNGVGFLYRLRADGALRETPVLVVTGIALDDQRSAELHELGALVHLKPIGVDELLAETRALVGEPSEDVPSPTPADVAHAALQPPVGQRVRQ